jgi:hypothetical protein
MLEAILRERDHSVDSYYNLRHLQHMFEGYRDRIVYGEEADCPYHPDGAREVSWTKGRKLAEEDLERNK